MNVPFEDNKIGLSYAAPLYIGQKEILYKTQLVGIDKNWSDWTKQTSREYINLPAGNYSFKVKAKSGGYRLLYVMIQTDEIVILHAFKKKTQKAPLRAIQLAEQRMKEVLK